MATARSVLVVTPTTGFGELIQQTLEATGLYKVMLVDSDQEAILCIQAVAFSIAILDSELPDQKLINLATVMRQKLPRMRLVMICSRDDPTYPAVEAFQPAGVLDKPFYLPDLLDVVARVLQTPSDVSGAEPHQPDIDKRSYMLAANSSPPSIPEWLQDISRAAQHLTRISLESDALAALILKDRQLWAYAGQLTQPAAQELAEKLSSFWDAPVEPAPQAGSPLSGRGDMVRFLRLISTEAEYMVYATPLGDGMVLSLAFEADTPFSKIRTQAGFLVKALSTPPGDQLPPAPRSRPTQSTLIRKINPPPEMPARLPPLLEDIPAPSPHKDTANQQPGISSSNWSHELAETDHQPSPSPSTSLNADYPTSPLIVQNSPAKSFPQPGKNITASIELRPNSTGMHCLSYAGMLVPRLPHHQLDGDLANRLKEWLDQLCLAFGWQVEQINIQPDFMQCVICVNPITSPGYLMRIIRQQTSQRIFTAFPLLAQDNPAEDFWAPGYLIISTAQIPSPDITQQYLENTRKHQGIPHTIMTNRT